MRKKTQNKYIKRKTLKATLKKVSLELTYLSKFAATFKGCCSSDVGHSNKRRLCCECLM